MALGPPMLPLILSSSEVKRLKSIDNLCNCSYFLVRQVPIALACGVGDADTAITQHMGFAGMAVGGGASAV